MANSSVTVTKANGWLRGASQSLTRVDIAYTADDSDGSIPNASVEDTTGFVVGVTHAPGTTAATTLTDVVAEDANGVDVLCGSGADIVTSANMQRVPNPDAASFGPFPTVGDLTVKITQPSGTETNDAVGVFSIFIA